LQEVLPSKTNSVLKGNNVQDAAASTTDGFQGEIHVFANSAE
jgi:hypothetical protein